MAMSRAASAARTSSVFSAACCPPTRLEQFSANADSDFARCLGLDVEPDRRVDAQQVFERDALLLKQLEYRVHASTAADHADIPGRLAHDPAQRVYVVGVRPSDQHHVGGGRDLDAVEG